MSKKLIVGDEIFDYPDTGDINYGEEATGWAQEITSVAAEVRGPGDIPTTETILIGLSSGGYVTGDVTNLSFDTAYVQRVSVEGFITRTYTDATPTQVEAFVIEGAYNGSVFNITIEFAGEETEVEFDVSGGQFTFKYKEIANTDQVTVKFKASAQVDEGFFA